MDIWQQNLAEHLISFIKNPSNLASTQEMYRIFAKNENFQKGAAIRLLQDENFKKLYNDWHFPKEINLQKLVQLPKNTFGHIYAVHTFFLVLALAPDLVGPAQAAVVVQVFGERFVFCAYSAGSTLREIE